MTDLEIDSTQHSAPANRYPATQRRIERQIDPGVKIVWRPTEPPPQVPRGMIPYAPACEAYLLSSSSWCLLTAAEVDVLREAGVPVVLEEGL
jgi:hypothetical protein